MGKCHAGALCDEARVNVLNILGREFQKLLRFETQI